MTERTEASREAMQRGVGYEQARRLPEAAECYLLAGGYSNAARVLNHLGWFYEAGLSLLLYLPRGETNVLLLSPQLRRLCLDASVCFARAGARPEVVALLTALGERNKAANLLVRAGLRQRAAALMRGDHAADSPWRPGVIGPLATRTGILRRVQALAQRQDPDYRPIFEPPTAGDSGGVRQPEPYVPEPAPPSPPPEALGPAEPHEDLRPAEPDEPFESPPPPVPPFTAGGTPQSAPSGSGSPELRDSEPPQASLRDPSEEEPLLPEETLFLTPGTVLRDRYRLEEQVGHGGMATVFRAWDLELDEPVALKVFLSVVANASLLKRFRREMKINRRLNHPNIVRTHEFGIWRGARYISMEMLEGQELWEFVRDHNPGPLEKLALMMQICDGLGHAHAQGIVHRDMKPSNLFVVNGGRTIKLMDFGIAKATDSSRISVTGVRVGTPRYMSPEQIQTGGTIGPASDLYGLGAVMYEMFTGRPVFDDEDLLPLLLNHLTEDPPPPSHHVPGLSPAIDEVCLRLLQKDPKDRYPDTAAARAALEAAYVASQVD